jgi:hypothetical protein
MKPRAALDESGRNNYRSLCETGKAPRSKPMSGTRTRIGSIRKSSWTTGWSRAENRRTSPAFNKEMIEEFCAGRHTGTSGMALAQLET